MRSFLPLCFALTLGGCADETPSDGDTDTDVDACPFVRPVRGEPGPLQAGFARARLPVPVGIGTAGYGPSPGLRSPSPFSELYPGSRYIHGHPGLRVAVLSRGEGHEAIFVRVDAVGVFSQLRNEVVKRASERLGRDIDHSLLFGATHTHSGPGRVVNTGSSTTSFFDLIADAFFPEFYERFVETVVDAIERAFDDLAPAELGTANAWCPDGHRDRRCEDGERYENSDLPLVAIRREGRIEGMVVSYAVHPTVFSLSDLHLSRDVAGGIEEAIEDRFDHLVSVLFFNSWGGDMSPGSPDGVAVDPLAATVNRKYQRVREVGEAVARSVDDVLGDLVWDDEPRLELETHRYRIDREAIGYPDDVFANFPFGGVYCSAVDPECVPGEPNPRIDNLDENCVPFSEAFPAPSQSSTTVGWVGPFAVVTYPGEPGTRLAEGLLERMSSTYDVDRVMFLGYTQDYLGYGLEEDDWWRGGYEASGALWGPRQGEHLRDRMLAAWDSFSNQSCPDEVWEPLEPFPYEIDAPYQVATPVQPATSVVEPEPELGPDGVVTWTFRGADPWLLAPQVQVIDVTNRAVTRPGGLAISSDDHNFDVTLEVEPPWNEEASERTFLWTVRMPVRQPVGGVSLSEGTYRLEARIPVGEGQVETLSSDGFEVVSAAD